MSIKIIHILHHSPSYTSTKLDDDIFNGWHAQTASVIQNLRIRNCQIECWLPEKTYNQQYQTTKENITYRVFPSITISYGREFSPLMRKAITQEEPHQILLHLHGIFNYTTYWIANRFKNIPIVAQHHGDCSPLSLLQRRKSLYLILPLLISEQKKCNKSLKYIDYFFCLTQACQKYLVKLDIKNKSDIQTMGVNFNHFLPAIKTEARKKLNLSTDTKFLLYVGRLDRYKGSDKLLQAFSYLKQTYKIELIIIGAAESDQFYNLAIAQGAKVFTRQAHEELIKFYQAVDILVLPGSSSYNQWGGIGVNVIESLACNTPVVSGTLQNFPDDYSQLGVFASNTQEIIDGVKYILNNPAQFSQCRTIAQKYYDWQIIAKNTLTIYQHLFLKYYNIKLESLHG